MSPILSKIRHWLQQPTTLVGLSLAIGGLAGAATGALSSDMATTLLLSACRLFCLTTAQLARQRHP